MTFTTSLRKSSVNGVHGKAKFFFFFLVTKKKAKFLLASFPQSEKHAIKY